MKDEPTAGALRAARAIERDASLLKSLPELIDRETGVREVLEILENIIAEAGDLIESRSRRRRLRSHRLILNKLSTGSLGYFTNCGSTTDNVQKTKHGLRSEMTRPTRLQARAQ